MKQLTGRHWDHISFVLRCYLYLIYHYNKTRECRGGWQIVTSNKFSGIIYKALPVPEQVLKLLTGTIYSAFPFLDNKGNLVRDFACFKHCMWSVYQEKTQFCSVQRTNSVQFNSTQLK